MPCLTFKAWDIHKLTLTSSVLMCFYLFGSSYFTGLCFPMILQKMSGILLLVLSWCGIVCRPF